MGVKRTVKLTFSRRGMAYVFERIPNMAVWAIICTITIVSLQYLSFSFLPITFFVNYDDTASAKDIKLGENPVIHYCRDSRDSYGVVLSGQLIKLDPPVYKKQYYIYAPIETGKHCLDRESMVKPDLPGRYQMYYVAEITLPFGIKKYEHFMTNAFDVLDSSAEKPQQTGDIELDTIKLYERNN